MIVPILGRMSCIMVSVESLERRGKGSRDVYEMGRILG